MTRAVHAPRLLRIFVFILALLVLAGTGVSAEPTQPGQWRWRFIAGGAIVGWPAADSRGRLYFAAEDRYLYALDSSGGMPWRVDLARRATGQVAVGPDGTVYVSLENGRFFAVNKDGRKLWEVALGAGEVLPPVVLSSGLVIAYEAGGRAAAYTHTGSLIWELDFGESLSCAAVATYHGQLVVGTAGGNLIAHDTAGRVRWKRYVSHVPSALAPHPDGILVGTTSGHLLDFGHEGEPRWRVDLGSAVAELVVGEGGRSYARLDDGSLAHVSASGVATWRANPSPARVESVTASHGVLMAISGGSLAHIRPDGTLHWQFRTPSDPLLIAPTGWGDAVLWSMNWVSYAFPMDLDDDSAWPLARGGPAASGLPPGIAVGRATESGYGSSFDYIYLSEFLRSPFEEDQLAGLRDIAGRVSRRPPGRTSGPRVTAALSGTHPYVLELCEQIAGAPYYGPVGYDSRPQVSRSARSLALEVLADVGDLGTTRFLLRLLRAEEATDMQAEIIDALASLGTGADGEVVRTIGQVIAADSVTDRNASLALAAIRCLEAVHAYEGGFLSADGVVLLMDIAGGPYERAVRDTATETLSRLSSW